MIFLYHYFTLLWNLIFIVGVGVVFIFRYEEVVPFFEVIERNEEVASTVMDYSISQTTLEEVFLNVSSYLPVSVSNCSRCVRACECVRAYASVHVHASAVLQPNIDDMHGTTSC